MALLVDIARTRIEPVREGDGFGPIIRAESGPAGYRGDIKVPVLSLSTWTLTSRTPMHEHGDTDIPAVTSGARGRRTGSLFFTPSHRADITVPGRPAGSRKAPPVRQSACR